MLLSPLLRYQAVLLEGCLSYSSVLISYLSTAISACSTKYPSLTSQQHNIALGVLRLEKSLQVKIPGHPFPAFEAMLILCFLD